MGKIHITLLGILSGRPFIARTDPFPSLENSELCPPRAVNLVTPSSGKKPREKPSRKSTINRRNPRAGRENQQRRRTVDHQTSYRAGEIFHCQQDPTTAVFITSHFTKVKKNTSANTVLDYFNTRYIEP